MIPKRSKPAGCEWCAYEVGAGLPIPQVRTATQVLETAKGPREVCDLHAERGRWRARPQRVRAVA